MPSLSLSRLLRAFNSRPALQTVTAAHSTAQEHWQRCTDSFIANPDYYRKCETALREDLVLRLGQCERLLDAGCGNGRFTSLLAEAAHTTEAYDLSESLIAEAKNTASEKGLTRIHFYVADVIATRPPAQAYDVVSCMGVLSTIIDDWAFQKVTRDLCNALRFGGLLLLRESVSLRPEGQLVEGDNYATCYRNENDYCAHWTKLGLGLEHMVPLAEFGTSVNKFYLYRK